MNNIKVYTFLSSKAIQNLGINFGRASYSNIAKTKEVTTDHLIDNYGRQHTYLRISLTERCNLRCKYCMPEEGVNLTKKSKLLTTDETLQLAELFVKQGVDKIRLTGGEPTVHKDLNYIISSLKSIPGLKKVAITTNGLVLTRELVKLQKSGLDIVNISLDTLKAEKFETVTRRKGWQRVIAGIDLAVQLGFEAVKVNVVAMKGFNDDEILDFVDFTKDRPVDVRFIEYMPFTGNKWDTEKMVPFDTMKKIILEKHPDFVPLPNMPNDTSKAFHVPGYKGKLGFITSMTNHFCGTCNRLRLMADGSLKVCLFGNSEISLRDALRNGCSQDDLLAMIGAAVKRKKKRHAGMLNLAQMPNRPMILIGLENQKKLDARISVLIRMKSNVMEQRRMMSSLTHVGGDGKASMVDVGHKVPSERTAKARGVIYVGDEVAALIRDNQLKKGDVLTIAQIAGIMGAKKTSEIIPLCHDIAINHVDVTAELKGDCVEITSQVKCNGKTGVEMEALTAVAIAALTIYDMCKAVTHKMVIKEIVLVQKAGGYRGVYDIDSS